MSKKRKLSESEVSSADGGNGIGLSHGEIGNYLSQQNGKNVFCLGVPDPGGSGSYTWYENPNGGAQMKPAELEAENKRFGNFPTTQPPGLEPFVPD
jgi:hypothetical protein